MLCLEGSLLTVHITSLIAGRAFVHKWDGEKHWRISANTATVDLFPQTRLRTRLLSCEISIADSNAGACCENALIFTENYILLQKTASTVGTRLKNNKFKKISHDQNYAEMFLLRDVEKRRTQEIADVVHATSDFTTSTCSPNKRSPPLIFHCGRLTWYVNAVIVEHSLSCSRTRV